MASAIGSRGAPASSTAGRAPSAWISARVDGHSRWVESVSEGKRAESMTRTCNPRPASAIAVADPAQRAPTMMASNSSAALVSVWLTATSVPTRDGFFGATNSSRRTLRCVATSVRLPVRRVVGFLRSNAVRRVGPGGTWCLAGCRAAPAPDDRVGESARGGRTGRGRCRRFRRTCVRWAW